ncbi:MAG: abhydrolase domain-containing 18 [Acidobacteria bacterium]|nr:abhydrolase domain-containing 18 [Acidobacteriota bacterium]
MLDFYRQWIDRWENELASRDTNRLVRPFEWGEEWLLGASANGDARERLEAYVAAAVADSDSFYSYERPSDFRLQGHQLTFTSAVHSRYPENNTVHGQFFPASKPDGRAVLVLPQFNSDFNGHVGLCKLLNRFGLSALRMSLSYHDRRMPAELERADYHVSSNVGRTIHATRQSVIDARSCLDWLESQGFTKLAILGTSLGSCVAFITAAHDRRLSVGVFNHVSMYFSDVVWTGISTRHVRQGLAGQLTQDELRNFWAVVSPATFLDRMTAHPLKSLLIWGRYDTSFLPVYSRQVLEAFRARKLPHKTFCLPCAHYTTGQFPFNLLDGLTMCRFLRRNL